MKALIVCATALVLLQSPPMEKFLGTWSGTWDGSGTGNFEITIDKTKEGQAVGRVAVTTDGGNYNADLKAIALEGDKLAAKYDFPLDGSAEVIVGATFSGTTAKGTWSLRPKGQNDEIASGTWTVTKK